MRVVVLLFSAMVAYRGATILVGYYGRTSIQLHFSMEKELGWLMVFLGVLVAVKAMRLAAPKTTPARPNQGAGFNVRDWKRQLVDACVGVWEAAFGPSPAWLLGRPVLRARLSILLVVTGAGATIALLTATSLRETAWRVETLPYNEEVRTVWAPGSDEIWVAGSGGLVLRRSGETWVRMATGTQALLKAMSGTRSADIWVVGSKATVLHWNGAAWKQHVVPTQDSFAAVWAENERSVWAVSSEMVVPGQSIIWHWNGETWSLAHRSANPLYGIYGSPNGTVWAVGEAGTVVRWDGRTWSAMKTPTSATLLCIWSSGPADVWAAGTSGTIIRYDGQQWSLVHEMAAVERVFGISGESRTNVWAVGNAGLVLHWNGGSWVRDSSADLLGDERGWYRPLLKQFGEVWIVGTEHSKDENGDYVARALVAHRKSKK